ncbi:hypothetical protein AB0M97_10570 [Streptomyces sp. NPDC051207]|uniref:hypothetical protein n=1 Tax=Streptomyces sp. NPDC051207 TaxID=3154641 RepID=UPI00341BD62C
MRPATEAGRPAAPRDPWQQGSDPGGHHDPTVDPHEVTVQLDAVQLGDGLIRRAASAAGGQDASDGPVFVDESGRRSRRFRRLGMAVALTCAVYAVVIVATLLSGSSDAPWLPVPGQQDQQPAGQVDTSPLPTGSTRPTGTGSPEPDTSPSPDDSTPPSPGTSTGAPAGPGGAGTSADPRPTQTRTTPRPGTGVGPAPTKGTPSPDTKDPEPTPTPTGTTVGPTGTTGGGEPAVADAVAAGPGDSTPAPGSPQEPGARSSTSPEYVL